MVLYLIILPLYEEFVRVVHSHTVTNEVPSIFIDADTRIKGVQIGDHEIKQYILPMTSPFFLRDITYLTIIEVFLKL